MITVRTGHGTFDFDAKPTDVTTSGPVLIINRNGHPIAKFRRWEYWHDTPAATHTTAPHQEGTPNET